MLNWNLARHPINWAIIFLMLAIAATGGHMLLTLAGIEPATGEGTSGTAAATTAGTARSLF